MLGPLRQTADGVGRCSGALGGLAENLDTAQSNLFYIQLGLALKSPLKKSYFVLVFSRSQQKLTILCCCCWRFVVPAIWYLQQVKTNTVDLKFIFDHPKSPLELVFESAESKQQHDIQVEMHCFLFQVVCTKPLNTSNQTHQHQIMHWIISVWKYGVSQNVFYTTLHR